MKKLAQIIFRKTRHQSLPVEDVLTHKKEIATSYQIFGIPYRVTYKAL